jgi:hypothetical protein
MSGAQKGGGGGEEAIGPGGAGWKGGVGPRRGGASHRARSTTNWARCSQAADAPCWASAVMTCMPEINYDALMMRRARH